MIAQGDLYGVTNQRGTNDNGTVYRITPAGSETVIHSFTGAVVGPDGAYPQGPLILVGNTLYRVTNAGGTSTKCSGGCGTLFAISLTGTETVLHSFDGVRDCQGPVGPLLNVNGTLYGNAGLGGQGNCGTACSWTPNGASGVFTVLHQFAGGAGDVCNPDTGFANLNGTLYAGALTYSSGLAQIVAMSLSGATSVDFTFTTADGGQLPGPLLPQSGTLWGASKSGGSSNAGTVFGLSP